MFVTESSYFHSLDARYHGENNNVSGRIIHISPRINFMFIGETPAFSGRISNKINVCLPDEKNNLNYNIRFITTYNGFVWIGTLFTI